MKGHIFSSREIYSLGVSFYTRQETVMELFTRIAEDLGCKLACRYDPVTNLDMKLVDGTLEDLLTIKELTKEILKGE